MGTSQSKKEVIIAQTGNSDAAVNLKNAKFTLTEVLELINSFCFLSAGFVVLYSSSVSQDYRKKVQAALRASQEKNKCSKVCKKGLSSV